MYDLYQRGRSKVWGEVEILHSRILNWQALAKYEDRLETGNVIVCVVFGIFLIGMIR